METGALIFYMICFGLANMAITLMSVHYARQTFDNRAFIVWLANGARDTNSLTADRIRQMQLMTKSMQITLLCWGIPEIVCSIIDGGLIANGIQLGPVAHVTMLFVYLIVGGILLAASYNFYRELPSDVSMQWHQIGDMRRRYAANEPPVTAEQLYNERKARKRKAASMSLFVRNRKTKRIEIPGRKIIR